MAPGFFPGAVPGLAVDKTAKAEHVRAGMAVGGRRLAIAVVVAAQVIALIAAYGSPYRVFGWQMFPESSSWRAEIFRVDGDGVRHDVREAWPGGYEWEDLVGGRLRAPFGRQHASYGLDATVDLLDAALDWVANHTPLDTTTVRLEADVTTWHNGRDPVTVHLASHDRRSGR